MSELRQLPSVDQLISTETISEYISVYGRLLTIQAIRKVLDDVRSSHRSGDDIPAEKDLLAMVAELGPPQLYSM